MPCPYFEPQNVSRDPRQANARLPLIDEYNGFCRAAPEPFAAPEELRFRCCNHGYSRGSCPHFPANESRSSIRYSVVRRTAATLEIICIEEQNYAPLRWHNLQYCLATGLLEPNLNDASMQAQAVAFCRSYLQHFSD